MNLRRCRVRSRLAGRRGPLRGHARASGVVGHRRRGARHRDGRRAVGAEPGVRPGHHAGHHRRRAAGPGKDQRASHEARRRRARFRRVGGGVRRRRDARQAEGRRRGVSDGDQAARPKQPAATLTVPGLVLTAPGDPMTLRSNAVELARVWKAATLRTVNKAKAGGLIEGRRLARVVGLPGADRSTQKVVRALMTGYLLHTLTGDKTYARLRRPRGRPAEGACRGSRSPTIRSTIENKVVALLKP